MTRLHSSILLLLLTSLYILFSALPSLARETITLQLKQTQIAHLAGYYIALKKGFYAQEGLEVQIKEAKEDTNVVDEVISGRAHYGVGTSSLLIERQKGKPVVVLAVIFQQSSNMLVTKYRSATQNIEELKDKDVMFGTDIEDILAYIKMEGLEKKINILKHSYDIEDLIKGRVYAMTINCPHPLDELTERGFKYHVYNPHTVGINFYGDNLFTKESEIKDHPERVKAFIRATLLGWQYVYASPEDAAQLIAEGLSHNVSTDKILSQIKAILPYMKADIVPIGYMHEGRWRFIADTLVNLGMLKNEFVLKGFLYKEPQPHNLKAILIAIITAFVAISIALYIYLLNKKLKNKVKELNSALDKLAESEKKYRMITEHTTDVIWTLDLQGSFTYISPSVERLRGYTPEEIMSQPAEMALTEGSRRHYLEGMKRIQEIAMSGGCINDIRIELEQPHKKGSTVWTEAIINGIYDEAGKLIGIIGVTRDISQRRDAELRLLTLYKAIEQLPIGVVIANIEGAVEYVNHRFLDMTGIAREDVEQLDYMSLVNSLGTSIDDKIWANIKGGSAWQSERQCGHKGGGKYWETITISPVNDDSGNITHLVSTHRDMSIKKQLESQVIRLLSILKTIGDNLPDSFIYQIIKTYPEGKRQYTYLSAGIRDLIGIEPEDAMRDASLVYNRIHPDDTSLFFKLEKETIENRKRFMSVDLRGFHISGEMKWVRVKSSYNYQEEGMKITVDGILLDITKQKQIEFELQNARQEALIASQAKGEFLANMSHEIRTPLHSLIGYTELLSGTNLNAEARSYVENMKSAGAALLCIINDILDFSKIESGKMTLFEEEIDIITLLEQTIDTVCLQAYQKGLEVIFAVAPDIPRYAYVDAVRLRQVLINLLGNAVKFTERGEVELRVLFEPIDASMGIFHFSVRDTGIGISEEYQRQIFESFIQIDSASTRQHSGTGLGLAISERLVNLMGSKIHLKSRLSEGSKFSFSIKTGYKTGLSEKPLLTSKKALVIINNDSVKSYLKELLTPCGINIQQCSNSNKAIEIALSHPDIDLLFADYRIFKDDGLDRLREIIHNLQKTTAELKIILILEPSTTIDTRYSPAWLSDAIHLFKPVKFNRLYDILRLCIRGKEYGQENTVIPQEIKGADAPIKILVVEDVPMNRVIIEKLIAKLTPESQVFKATNGKEAIEQYVCNLPDLIFMDVQMPEMDGISATKVIREKETDLQRRATIIALTAGNTESERCRCMEVGMDCFLSKPIDIRVLKDILKKGPLT